MLSRSGLGLALHSNLTIISYSSLYNDNKGAGKKSRNVKTFTLSVLLLLLPLASVDDHPSVEALQETRRLLSLLHLNLEPTDTENETNN